MKIVQIEYSSGFQLSTFEKNIYINTYTYIYKVVNDTRLNVVYYDRYSAHGIIISNIIRINK